MHRSSDGRRSAEKKNAASVERCDSWPTKYELCRSWPHSVGNFALPLALRDKIQLAGLNLPRHMKNADCSNAISTNERYPLLSAPIALEASEPLRRECSTERNNARYFPPLEYTSIASASVNKNLCFQRTSLTVSHLTQLSLTRWPYTATSTSTHGSY
jgi:hypothetical protein